MTSLFNSLAEISSEYTVFEKDQILTEAQLNGLASYLDDQDRLNRISLIGVGIICGLRPNLASNLVTISKGVGITTDGDLLRLAANTRYDRYKAYDDQFPVYPPLYTNETTMLTAYELVREGEADPLAADLSDFASTTGDSFADMVVVLLMESYVKDHDLCSGTDCDNHSQLYTTKIKPLLIAKSDIAALTPDIQTAEQAARSLNLLTADRVTISDAITTTAQFASQYRTAATNIHNRLVAELPNLWSEAAFLLGDSFNSNPVPSWISQLNSIRSSFSNNNTGIQYYYDFLKDVVETWNALREAFFAETAWCCPDINGFPKHLLLGDLVTGTDANANRLNFYPSAAISREQGVKHGIFLAEKLGSLISGFTIPSSGTVRVTPSSMNHHELEQRAIPWYYTTTASSAVLSHWSYPLHQRDMQRYNYSYHASSYNAQGAAADPLNFSIDRHDFFRIEGHIGQSADSVLSTLENTISEYNLPFSVVGIVLGTSRGNIVNKRGAGYTDLNRFHHILRKDLVYRLDDVTQFSNSYKLKIDQAVTAGTVKNDTVGNDGTSVQTIAANKTTTVNQKSSSAQQKLNMNYTAYLADTSWQTDINDVMINASQYKYELGKVSKTEFVTPFDNLISNNYSDWLGWLDILIADKNDKADDKKLFRNFINEYPGLEHAAGVVRGGTFVILYNTSGTVIGDLMLSHYYKEVTEPEAETTEPTLPKPTLPKDWIIDSGIQINPSWDNLITDKLDIFKLDIDTEWQTKFDVSTYYADVFKETIGTIYTGGITLPGGGDIAAPGGGITTPGGGSTFPGGEVTLPGGGIIMVDEGTINPGNVYVDDGRLTQPVDTLFEDKLLGKYGTQVDTQMGQIKEYDAALAAGGLSQTEQTFLETQKAAAEQDLSRTLGAMTEYMSVKNTSVGSTTDGQVAMQIIGNGMKTIEGNAELQESTRTQLTGIQGSTGNTELAAGLGGLLGF